MSAVQSASFTHAEFCAQQLASMHESHVASPVRRPHVPASVPVGGSATDFFTFAFASAETAFATPLGRDSASFDCHVFAAVCDPPLLPGVGTVSMVVVLVQAKVIADAMAIAPKVIALMMSSKGLHAGRSLEPTLRP